MRSRTNVSIRCGLALGLALFASSESAWCARAFEFSFAAPERVVDAAGTLVTINATVLIAAAGVESEAESIEAWSMGIRITGCSVSGIETSATFSDAGTVDFVSARRRAGDIALAVVLDVAGDGAAPTLPVGTGPYPVLGVTLEAEVPTTTDCNSCRLEFAGDVRIDGQAIKNVVTASGQSFAPLLSTKTIRLEAPPEPAQPPIELTASETELTSTLDACRRDLRSRFTLPPPTAGELPPPVLLRLASGDPFSSVALYARWDEEATPIEFDAARDERGQSQTQLVIPLTRLGTLHVLVQRTDPGGSAAEVTLTARTAALLLESITPALVAEESTVTATLRGGGFDAGFSNFALLHPDGATLTPTRVRIVSADRAEATFDLNGAPRGDYTVKVSDPSGEIVDTLEERLRVGARSELFGLELELFGQSRYEIATDEGELLQHRLTLAYRNVSNAPMNAPLFRVRAPFGTRLRLESETPFQDEELLILGIDPNGAAGELAPGAGREVALVFVSERVGDASRFDVELFTPTAGDFVGWQALAAPLGVETATWLGLVPRLSEFFGPTWESFHQRLGELATRLTPRGLDSASVLALLQFAVDEAAGEPSAAIVGQVIDTSGAPVGNTAIGAFDGAQLTARSTTDGAGTFALECLSPATTYDVRVDGFTPATTVFVPVDRDAFAQLLTVGPGGDSIASSGANCGVANGELGLSPREPIVPPSRLFTPLFTFHTDLVGAIDPNEKDGPSGEGELGCVDLPPPPGTEGFRRGGCVGPDSRLFFTIHFENVGNAPARRVTIVDTLDETIDLSTVRLLDFSLANKPPPVSLDMQAIDRFSGYLSSPSSERFSLTTTNQYEHEWPFDSGTIRRPTVQTDATIDLETRSIVWEFRTLSEDGEPLSVDDGFLLPGGQGSVSFVARADAVEGDDVLNRAVIIFDGLVGQAIATNGTANRFSEFLPAAPPQNPIPADGATVSTSTPLLWQASQHAFFYDVFLWVEGTPPAAMPLGFDLPSPSFRPDALLAETNYIWRVDAINLRGDRTPGPEWRFRTESAPPCPGAPAGLTVALNERCEAPLLSWEESPNARAYTVAVRQADELVALVQGVTENSYRLASLPPGDYSWSVIALGESCPFGSEVSESAPLAVSVCGFRRGDVNADGGKDISDAIALLNHLFVAGFDAPPCSKAADVNDDGSVDISDAIACLNHLFVADSPAPSFPSGNCGSDPTPDALLCERFDPCGHVP